MTRFLRGLALITIVAPAIANATLIEFSPADSIAGLGDVVAIDIIATPENGEMIAAFDFLVNFDPTILAINSVVFGSSLNTAASLDSILCILAPCRGATDTGGALSIFEVSALFPSVSVLQDGISSVTLATIIFDTIGVGVSALSFTGNIPGEDAPFNFLGGDFGARLPVLDPGTGTVTVVQVAEPPTLLLMLIGLFAVVAGSKSRQRHAGAR